MAALADLPAEYEALLVGGAIRDRLLEREVRDFDAVVAHGGERVAELLGERLGGRAFKLGGDRFAAYRIEVDGGRLDLWDRQPMSLEADLERRDVTVNAIAYRLSDRRLIDPFGGLEDLDGRTLRATSRASFVDDPLRVIRLARFAVQLQGFSIEPATLKLAREASDRLGDVASERIREELRIALGRRGSHRVVERLRELAVYPDLWYAGAVDPGDLLGRRLALLDRRADELEADLRPGAVDRFVAVHAVLFAEVAAGGERLSELHARGLVSNRELRAIEALLAWSRIGDTLEERRWFLHRLGELWPAATSFLGSQLPEAAWRELRSSLVELASTRAEVIFTPPPLLNGHEISEILALPPGPELGGIAARLRRAQVEGRVTTRSAAVAWLERNGRA